MNTKDEIKTLDTNTMDSVTGGYRGFHGYRPGWGGWGPRAWGGWYGGPRANYWPLAYAAAFAAASQPAGPTVIYV